jgi:16S rRNA (guanine966-N2)-methyltransferase
MTAPPRTRAGPAARSTHNRGAKSRQLRIIGGTWRGRRWQFPDSGMRPTADRVRETLFNWLQGRLDGRWCLDLYAGSGALGLEALSRGAAHCVFVDEDARAVEGIGDALRAWGADSQRAELVRERAERYLARAARRFDLVFLDPPFATGELAASAAALCARGWLAPGALVYTEHARRGAQAQLPAALRRLREGAAGAVGYDLYEYA